MDHCRSDDEKQNHIQVSGVNKLYHYREPYKPKNKLLRISKSHGYQSQAYFQQTRYAATHIYSQEQSNLAQHRSFLYALQLKTSISLLQDIICTFLESALTIFTMLNYPAQHRHLRSDHIKCPYNCQNR